MLYEKLEREASGGPSLSKLEAEIDKQGRRLNDVQREEAWLYAWALSKRRGRLLFGSVWEGPAYGDVGDTGAG